MQDIRVVSIVGGQSIEEQGFKLRQVRNWCNVVWSGRLLFKSYDTILWNEEAF